MRYRSRGSKASFPAAFAGLCLLVFATGVAGAGDDGDAVTVSGPPNLVELRGGGPDHRPAPDAISAFVRRIFEDSQGNLWLGTNGDGVARFDGESLVDFAAAEGFVGEAVRGIVEDHDQHLWFATNRGVTRYADGRFTHYTTAHGLSANDTWAIFVDGSGTVWAGTQDGPCTFDGERFVPVAIPAAAERDHARGVSGPRMVRDIMQDDTGRIWIAAEAGVFHYDGTTVTSFSDGTALEGQSINCMLEDGDGNVWFATHYDGVIRYDGHTFTNVSDESGLRGTEVWNLYLDHDGDIWFPVENEGLVRTDGHTYETFSEAQGILGGAIQTTHRDRAGRLWAGGYLGLFRLEGQAFVAVGRDDLGGR
jgi:ligand-binding sensor domain-containing protein